MEILLHKQAKEVESLSIKINNLENNVKNSHRKFKCENCDFTSVTEQGLKSHRSKKHKSAQQEEDIEFPTNCNLCEKIIKTSKEMKVHRKTHSYKMVQFQCTMCSYLHEDEIGIEVHIGKVHGETFECGLCGCITKDLEDLETHLLTCEI